MNNTKNTIAQIRSIREGVKHLNNQLDQKQRHNDLLRIMRSNNPQPTTRKVDIVDALRSIQAVNA
jgi:hypothetical protein